jgi:DNA-binding response OmpR family regulator
LGKGTTFEIRLPAVDAKPDARAAAKEEPVRGGDETILLAEDDEPVRMLVDRTLKDLGYTVLIARNGEEAVTLFKENRSRISLALLDVVMPLKGGKEAYEEMHKMNPALKVIFMSGYTANSIHESIVLNAGTPFLAKPFGPEALAKKMRETLDRD